MQKTKLIDLLKKLSKRECAQFNDYVYSPFFNKNEKLRRLCTAILAYTPKYDHKKLTRKALYPLLFPKGAYQELRINNLISDLLQLLYGFLAQQQLPPVYQNHLLLEGLLQRDAYPHVERIARRYRQAQDRTEQRNHQYFHQEHLLYGQMDQLLLNQSKRRYDENLQLHNDALDRYYFGNKLRIACDMASRNNVIKAGYICHFQEDLIRYYEENYQDYQLIPALNVYYLALQMITQPSKEQYYQQLKLTLDEHSALFPKQELSILYTYAINFCIKKINSGKSEYYHEILELYKALLEKEIIFHTGSQTQWTFKNIITVGIRLEAFEWTENFIQQYEDYLPPEEKFNAVTYNRAALYSAQKDYLNALRQLHNVEFTDSSYHLGAKIIQLKSYYELEETEALYALIEAFKKYLLRNRGLADYRIKANANMLRLAKHIYQLKVNQKTMSPSAFYQKYRRVEGQLVNLNPIANKEWLLEIFSRLSPK